MGGRGQTGKELAGFSDYYVSFEPVKERWKPDEIPAPLRAGLKEFCAALTDAPDWSADGLEAQARTWTEENGVKMKDYAMTLRLALTGMKVSPGVFEVAALLDRDEVKKRLEFFGIV